MRYAIIGPGALGCLLAAALGDQHEVWLLDHDPTRAAQLNQQQILLTKNGRERPIPIRATANPADLAGIDCGLLCVKSKAVAQALTRSLPGLGGCRLIIAFENGIAHLEVIPALLQKIPWAVGVTGLGATLTGPGQIRFGGEGLTRMGFLAAEPDAPTIALLTAVANDFRQSGLPTEISMNILGPIWDKLLINCGINALTAIRNCPNGDLLNDSETISMLTTAVKEGEAVAKTLGVSITPDPVERTMAVCRATAANISSMLQDVRRHRPTEIDAINGAVVHLAETLGLPSEMNRELTRQIRNLEESAPLFP
ncbi:MAG: 2-dehydropantoate 2-reductase [Proteobacteria bacterium]|nr:2-dehydropantoate 2-reductase [Pseudomonadota bacterium]MBU1687399.1 2-dehydropantoate 2-reductase [Pseudomonadota bacterium]